MLIHQADREFSCIDYSRLEAGAIDIESIEFDLRDVIENAAATVGHIAQAKKLEVLVESTVDADPKHVLLGDPHRLRQALLNILVNLMTRMAESCLLRCDM